MATKMDEEYSTPLNVEDEFFLLERYNEMMDFISQTFNFMICEKSAIRAKTSIVFSQGCDDYNCYNFVDLATTNKCNYMSCVTDRSGSHICDFYPVMIGSNLDIFLVKNYGNFNDYIPIKKITGYYIINGSLAIFPFLLTNRKDLIHIGNKVYDQKIFIYNKDNMGYKIYVNENTNLVYRNEKGVEINIYSKKESCNLGIKHKKIQIDNYYINDEHLDINNMKFAFHLLSKFMINIDSFHNKLILSPSNILHLASIISKKRGEEVAMYLRQGNLSKFDSLKLDYVKERNSFGNSFEYRMVQPNSIGRKYLDRVVIRLIATNVSNKVITDAEHYICIIEKNISIDSFNKVLNLLPNVKISDHLSYLENDLDLILDELVLENYIVPIDYDKLSDNDIYILLNGGLMSPYKLNTPVLELYHHIKNINEMIEVLYMDKWIMINQTNGLPFIKVRNIFTTPLELKNIYPHIHLSNELEIFGYNTKQESTFLKYSNITKCIAGMNYHKTRLSNDQVQKYYGYTTETILTYINDEKFDDNLENLQANIIFSTHPQISGDGYIVNKNFNINTNLIVRMRLEIDVYLDTIVTCNPINKDSFLVERDDLGNVIAKTACVMKLTTNSELLPFKIFHQNKFSESRSISNKESNIFKRFEESECLRDDVEFKIICLEKFDKKTSNKRRIVYEMALFQTVPFYDGLKFSDICSQKGLATQQDLSRYKNVLGREPDVVTSLFTVLSRASIPQIKAIASKRKSLKDVRVPGSGGQRLNRILYSPYNLDILKNTSLGMLNKSGVNYDLYTNKVMMTNNLSFTLYGLAQRAFNRKEYMKFLPDENFFALNTFNILKTAFEFQDLNNNRFVDVNVNKGIDLKSLELSKTSDNLGENNIYWVASKFSNFQLDINDVEDDNDVLTLPIFNSSTLNPNKLNMFNKNIVDFNVDYNKHANFYKIMDIDNKVDIFKDDLNILELNFDHSNEPFTNYITSKYNCVVENLEIANEFDIFISTMNLDYTFDMLHFQIKTFLKKLKFGGSCIIRIYDGISEHMLILMYLLYHSFQDFSIYKTLWDESLDEKYIICLYKTKDLNIYIENLKKIPIKVILKDVVFYNYIYSLFNNKN